MNTEEKSFGHYLIGVFLIGVVFTGLWCVISTNREFHKKSTTPTLGCPYPTDFEVPMKDGGVCRIIGEIHYNADSVTNDEVYTALAFLNICVQREISKYTREDLFNTQPHKVTSDIKEIFSSEDDRFRWSCEYFGAFECETYEKLYKGKKLTKTTH